MMKGNGAAHHAAVANGAGLPQPGSEPSVVMVNFGLKARHIYAGLAAVPAGLAALATAGWLVLPATRTDLTRVETGLEAIKTEVKTLNAVNAEIIAAVRDLKLAVMELRSAPPAQAAPRLRQPSKPVPASGALFGF